MSHSAPISTKAAAINFLRRIHFYIGLFIAPFIFVAALTGTLYVLTPQLENAIYADALYVNPQGATRPLSEQIETAQHHAGQQAKIYAVRPAPETRYTTRVQFADASYGASESRAIFVDPYTLQIKGDMMVYGTSGVLPIRLWLDKAHRTLLLGDLGCCIGRTAALVQHPRVAQDGKKRKHFPEKSPLAHNAGPGALCGPDLCIGDGPDLVALGRRQYQPIARRHGMAHATGQHLAGS